MSNYRKKKFFVLTLGEFLEALGSEIGTCSVFCHSFSLSNNVSGATIVQKQVGEEGCQKIIKIHHIVQTHFWLLLAEHICSKTQFVSSQASNFQTTMQQELVKNTKYCVSHGPRTPRESFFSKISNFWAWADILG